MRKSAVILVTCFLASTAAFSADRIRESFEWGEYDSLFVELGNYFSSKLDTVESDTDCIYFSYLGVAWFAKGDIAEAQRQFRTALDCEPALTLDKKYVTPEMMNLFSSVKNEMEQQRAYLLQEKSIQEATVVQKYEQESNMKQAAELRSTFWKNSTVAAATGLISLALGSFAVNEYNKGDKSSMVSLSMSSAICGSLCAVFTVKSFSLRRMMEHSDDVSREHPVEDRKSY
jgi:hypothetical protein